MITIISIAAAAIILNLVGRFLLLREDLGMGKGWRLAVKICPGAELAYAAVRWQRGRLGCLACGVSLVMAVAVAPDVATAVRAQINGTAFESPGSLTEWIQRLTQPGKASARPDVAKAIRQKENKIEDLNRYLQDWFAVLSDRQGYLCDEIPEGIAEYNRMAAAYHSLLEVCKTEQRLLAELSATKR